MVRRWWTIIPLLIFSGCFEDGFDLNKVSDDITVSPSINIAIARVNVNLGEVFSEISDKVYYYHDKEGNERIKYFERSNSHSIGMEDLFSLSIPPIEIPIPFANFSSSNHSNINLDIPIIIPNSQIEKLGISYTLEMSCSNFIEPLNISLIFPTSNHSEHGRTIYFNLHNSESISTEVSSDILTLTDNKIPVYLSINSQNIISPPSNAIGKLSIILKNIELEYFNGFMDELTIVIDDKEFNLTFDLFEVSNFGVFFDNPNLKMIIENQTPFKGIIIPDLKGVADDDTKLQIFIPPLSFNERKNINKPSFDTTLVDKTNSNIRDLFNLPPTKITFGGSLSLNPEGEKNDRIEFFKKNRILAKYEVEIPVEFKMDATLDSDTTKVDLSDLAENAQQATMVISSQNGCPLKGEVSLGIYNSESDQILDVIEFDLIEAAPVNEEGLVTSEVFKTSEIILSPQQIKFLSQADRIITNLALTTTDFDKDKIIVLLTSYQLKVNISLKAQLTDYKL